MTTPQNDLALHGTCVIEMLMLARVSTASRKELIDHLRTAFGPHMGDPDVLAIHDAAREPDVLARGAAGQRARAALGWSTVYAPKSSRELGVLAQRGRVAVLFINASAAQRDLGEDGNSFVSIFERLVADPLFQGRDPHAPADSRPQVLGPNVDRFIRDEQLGWQMFNAVKGAYGVFRIAGKETLDTLDSDAKTRWTMYAWEASSSKKATTVRLTDGELNYFRAGDHGGSRLSLLRGYRWEQESMPDGTWRRVCDATDRTTIEHRPEPDPEAWWEVETILSAALDVEVNTWRELADRIGRAGIRSRGADEMGTPIHQLADPMSAAKLLLEPAKLDALVTGQLDYTRIGPGDGVWETPSGHQFQPRWHGDDRGQITYTVNLGLPTWPVGFDAEAIAAIKEKWWPAGVSVKHESGRAATDLPRRPLAGVFRWTDETHRYEVFSHGTRYELRRQSLAAARRTADGGLAAMRAEHGELVASWRERELTTPVADLIDQAVEAILAEHDDAAFAPVTVTPARPPQDHGALRRGRLANLERQLQELIAQRDGARELSNLLAAKGDSLAALAKHDEASEHEAQVATLSMQLEEVATGGDEDEEPEPRDAPTIDVGTPALLVEALRGRFGSGPQPAELNRAVRTFVGADQRMRVELIPGDRLNVRISGLVKITLSDGDVLSVPVSATVPAKLGDMSSTSRASELARLYMQDGLSIEAAAGEGRSANPAQVLRRVRELLGASSNGEGGMSPYIPHAGLRRAAVEALPVTRQVLWSGLNSLPFPDGLPKGFGEHLVGRYIKRPGDEQVPADWAGPWTRTQAIRYRTLAVLLSTERTRTVGMRTNHLAACLGVSVDDINNISRDWPLRDRTDPRTLARVGPFADLNYSHLDAADKRVAPLRCAHRSKDRDGLCAGEVVAVLFNPEVLVTGSGALCVACRRPPESDQQFPVEYIGDALDRIKAYTGEWEHCVYRECEVDFGAGAGLMWSPAGSRIPVAHGPECVQGRPVSKRPTEVSECGHQRCTTDEGYGPGVIAHVGTRGRRRWHDGSCERAARLELQDAKRAAAAPVRCSSSTCVVDEGVGPGLLDPTRGRPSRKWHGRACKVAASRSVAGRAPAGTVIWSSCGHGACVVDEGGGQGMVRTVVGDSGRPRKYHDSRCGARARRDRERL